MHQTLKDIAFEAVNGVILDCIKKDCALAAEEGLLSTDVKFYDTVINYKQTDTMVLYLKEKCNINVTMEKIDDKYIFHCDWRHQ